MSLSDPLLSAGGRGEDELDVLVVGAGPAGLLAAIDLVSQGCRVRIIDALEEPASITKATGIVMRSVEILPLAVSQRIKREANYLSQARLNELDMQGKNTVVGTLSFGSAGVHTQPQWKTEQMLAEHLAALRSPGESTGVKVDRPYKLVGLQDTKDCVEAQLENASTGTRQTLRAKYLVGADGGRSTARKLLGFPFEGEPTAEYFFALHAALDNFVGEESSMDIFFSRGKDAAAPGFAFAMPLQEKYYLLTLDLDSNQQAKWKTGEMDRNGLPVLRQPTPEEVVDILRTRGCGSSLAYRPGTVKWVAHFRVQSRLAAHYGKGRVYLVGDACHCHSPLGGQGMNMSFVDAKNLAWKLAASAKGALNPARALATYEEERRTIDRKITTAIHTGQKMASARLSPVAFFLRGRGQRLGPTLLSYTGGADYASQQAWSYAGGSMCDEHWERPPPVPRSLCPAGGYRRRQNLFRWIGRRVRAGDRAPDVDGLNDRLKEAKGWTLLLFQGCEEHNAELANHIRGAKVYDMATLNEIGRSLVEQPDSSGFVGGIGQFVVYPAGDAAHKEFGVRGQCLYLVRPDHHIGFRSEPVREGAVTRYFQHSCGMLKVKAFPCAPKSAPSFDVLPAGVWMAITAVCFASAFSFSSSERPLCLKVACGFSLCLSMLLYCISQPKQLGPSVD